LFDNRVGTKRKRTLRDVRLGSTNPVEPQNEKLLIVMLSGQSSDKFQTDSEICYVKVPVVQRPL
jgi:hypothetical protein